MPKKSSKKLNKNAKAVVQNAQESAAVSGEKSVKCRALEVGHRSCKCGGEYCPVN
jgi:hypothetical protein